MAIPVATLRTLSLDNAWPPINQLQSKILAAVLKKML
jgi:hypothetical protein